MRTKGLFLAVISVLADLIRVMFNFKNISKMKSNNYWVGRLAIIIASLLNLLRRLKADATVWGLDPAMVSSFENKVNLAKEYYDKCLDKTMRTAQDIEYRDRLIEYAVEYALGTIKFALYANPLVPDPDLKLMHFPPRKKSKKGKRDVSKIVGLLTVVANTLGYFILALRNQEIVNAEMGWPNDGSRFVRFEWRLIDNKEWNTVIVESLRTRIDFPPSDRGKDYICRAAFMTHSRDNPINWSEEILVSLPKTLEDILNHVSEGIEKEENA